MNANARIGEVYGLLTITRYSHSRSYGTFWHCKCQCGNETVVYLGNLTSGATTSCGCKVKTQGGLRGGSNKLKAGDIAMVWKSMMDRCTLPSASNYAQYGARGIKVCERWKYLPNFIEDMGQPPTPQHTIDRIDNEGDYTPENCRWSTKKEQARNRRDNRMLTFMGKTQCVTAWREELGIPRTTFYTWLKAGELSKIFAHYKG